jgi:V/A-type H+-transporting ATPase subunit I
MIARIKKLEIIALRQEREKILSSLQKLGIVELMEAQAQTLQPAAPAALAEINLLEIEEAIVYLASFKAEKTGFLEGIFGLKPWVLERQLNEAVANFDYAALLKKVSELRKHQQNLTQHREKLIQERQLLASWQEFKVPLDQMQYTSTCGILLGILRTNDCKNLLKNCQEETLPLFCEVISQDRTNTHLAVLYLKKDFERLETVLKNHHFNFVTLGRHKGTVRERLLEINRQIMVLDDQVHDTKMQIAQLAQEQFKLMLVYDYFLNIKVAKEQEKNLSRQQYTFSLKAWIKEKDIKLLEKEMQTQSKDTAIFISEPGEQENIPVILENKTLIQPFEFITQIYGMPKYHELDPTPFLAPFFFLYFGFCVSDVGYGLMLALICWWALKKFKMGRQGRKAFRLFLFCSISTIIIGVATGSWFGNLFELLAENNRIFLPLKKFKDSLVVLDPLKEPKKLLGIALMFGIIQVWFGNILAGIGNIKNRRYLDTVLDQVPILIFLFGLTGWGLIFLSLLGRTQINLFQYAILAGAVILILTQGRAEKNIGAKLFYGAYYLYNTFSGYLGDILSYSRLWALGLVTSVMAGTINLIAVQFSQILPSAVPFIHKISLLKIIISILTLVIIFIGGHLVSFAMNLLGAFVHPLRLQFVEFFSKFFKPGQAFKPFKIETKYIKVSLGCHETRSFR